MGTTFSSSYSASGDKRGKEQGPPSTPTHVISKDQTRSAIVTSLPFPIRKVSHLNPPISQHCNPRKLHSSANMIIGKKVRRNLFGGVRDGQFHDGRACLENLKIGPTSFRLCCFEMVRTVSGNGQLTTSPWCTMELSDLQRQEGNCRVDCRIGTREKSYFADCR